MKSPNILNKAGTETRFAIYLKGKGKKWGEITNNGQYK
jgi:hypothetical protein